MEEKDKKTSLPENAPEQSDALTRHEQMKKRFFLQPHETKNTCPPAERGSVAGEVSLVTALSMAGERMRFLRSPEYIARFYGKDSEQYRRAIEKQGEDD